MDRFNTIADANGNNWPANKARPVADGADRGEEIDPEETRPTRVLLIDDNEDDFLLTKRMISHGNSGEFVLDWVCDYAGGEAALLENNHDVYLIDYRLGAEDGIDLLLKVQDVGTCPAMIMLTGEDDQDIATRSIQLGASDFLIKGQIIAPLLIRSIRYAIARRQISRQEAESKELLKRKNQHLSELYATAHQFVDNVSHEFRTPLTVIKEFASILSDGLAGELNEEQQEFTGIILSRVDDLSHMVNDMLDISRLEAGLLGVQRREYHVKEIIDRVRSTLARKAAASGIVLEFSLDPALPTVYCDTENIGRVIINLVVNACKFSGDAGQVALRVHHNPGKSEVVFSITDNGPGIAPEHAKAIFKRFEQVGSDVRASNKGVGLGLNIAKELIFVNFGDIGVDSEVGKGSTFTFTVPVFDPVSILTSFLGSLPNFRFGSSHATLISVCADSSADAAACDALEQFLERQMRRCDLLFRLDVQRWIVCAGIDSKQMADMKDRLQSAREDSNRISPEIHLPDMKFTVKATWSVGQTTDEFVAAFQVEWSIASAIRTALSLQQRSVVTSQGWDNTKSA